MTQMPAGSLVVLTAEGAVALGPDVADAPEPELSRAVYDQMCTLGLRQEILTALVFVIEADGQEVEMCRRSARLVVGGRLARAGQQRWQGLAPPAPRREHGLGLASPCRE
jgi:hypothetical protein